MKKLKFLIFFIIISTIAFAQMCPQPIGASQSKGAFAIDVQDNYAFVADYDEGLVVYDISNPRNPTRKYVFYIWDASDVLIYKNYAIIASWNDGIIIMDISNPTNPFKVGSYKNYTGVWRLGRKGNLIYAGEGESAGSNGIIEVLDISDPRNPVLVGSYRAAYNIAEIKINGNYAYVLTSDYWWNIGGGLRILDISNPNPVEIGSYNPNNPYDFFMDIELKNNIAYITYNNIKSKEWFIAFLDVSNPYSPRLISQYKYSQQTFEYGIGLYGDVAFLAGDKLMVFDVSNIYNVKEIGNFGTDQWDCRDILINYPYAYVPSYDSGLYVFDISSCASGPSSEFSSIIPAAAHAAGSAGSNWRTDLNLYNDNNVTKSVKISLLKRDEDNTNPLSVDLVLSSHQNLFIEDVVSSKFGFSGAGAIKISSDNPNIKAFSRTYNYLSSGTYGQGIPGYPETDLFTQGNVAVLLNLRKDSNFRTNIGFASLTSYPINITVELYDQNGNLINKSNYNLKTYGYTQIDDILGKAGQNNINGAYAKVYTTTENAKFIPYASVVDNRTNDPCFVSPVKE